MSIGPDSGNPALQQRTEAGLLRCLLVGAAALLVQAIVLLAMAQPAICACGTVKLWHGVILSSENSQHISDWYTFTHVVHGFAFYFLLSLLLPRAPLAVRFAMALALEVGWEILENTPWIIERYRQTAVAQGYFGDSVVNSMFDTVAMVLGFWLARLLPVSATVALALAIEISLGYLIRDNLALNIIQLVYPNADISAWQAGP